MARYLIVKIEEDDTWGHDSDFVKVRQAIHQFKSVSDFGLDGAAPVTDAERQTVVELFETVMRRAKAAHKALEGERAPEGFRWVSCSQEMSWAAAQYRHLAPRGGLTTKCGATASTPEIWRGNSTKEKCPECLDMVKKES